MFAVVARNSTLHVSSAKTPFTDTYSTYTHPALFPLLNLRKLDYSRYDDTQDTFDLMFHCFTNYVVCKDTNIKVKQPRV